jgi:hypothetical protein
MKDDRAAPQDLLQPPGIFSRHLHDHVDKFGGTKSLAHDRANAEMSRFFFGVFYGDGFGQ